MLEKLPNFFSFIRIKVPNTHSKQKFDLIIPNPEFDLKQIADGLGAAHQLTVPGPDLFLGQKIFRLLAVDQMPKWMTLVIQ